MKIKSGDKYSVTLYEEPNKKNDHTKNLNGTLEFTGTDLVNAIVSVGMPDIYLTKAEKRKRKDDIYFKIKLFETYVSSTGGKLSFDNLRKPYLDSTEIGAINYWIGMVLTTVLGQVKYDYDFMVHLSMIQLFSSKIKLKKRKFLSTTGNISFKSPDLLAINILGKKFGVFESKGYSKYDKNAMERAYDQAKSIKRINRKKPDNSLVVMTLTGKKEIEMIQKDPDGENCEIEIDLEFLYLYHFLPIVELIGELKPEENNDSMCGTLVYEDSCYSISLPKELYHELYSITESNEESFINTIRNKLADDKKDLSNIISGQKKSKVFVVKEIVG